MSDPTLAPEPAVPLAGSAAEVIAWRTGGQLHLTVVAKATFAFAPEAEMPRVEPQPILRAEVYHGNSPARSARYGGDLAPHLGRADVLFTGSACAPAPGPAQAMYVRIVVIRGEGAVVDKRILVRDPRGFQRLPVVYEHAFGGLGVAENPLGVGEPEGSGVPFFFDLHDARRPAGFGPIARAWPARRRLLGAVSRKSLDAPIAEIPTPFDWSYFQAAPVDQRTDFLRGDEWILLEGLHPEHALLRTRLPGARGVARIHGLSAFGVPEGHPLDLAADTLRIQGDDQRCTLVCRRSFPLLAGDAALPSVRVLAGVAIGAGPIDWPALPPEASARAAVPVAVQREAAPPGATMALPAGDESGVPGTAVLPFISAPAPVPPASSSVGGRAPSETLALSFDDAPLPPPLPFRPEPAALFPPAPKPAPPAAPPSRVATGTLAISPDTPLDGEGTLPFAELSQVAFAPALPPFAVIRHAPLEEAVQAPAVPAPDPGVIPYFAAPTAPAAVAPEAALEAEPPPREPDPAAFPLEKLAAIAAEIAEKRAPRDEVLLARAVEEPVFSAAERHWTAAIKKDAARGPGKLRAAYDAAYVAAVEKLRGPITPAEYARLVVATERKESDEALDALGIQKPALMCIIRLWTRKVAADGRLYVEVSAAMAGLRAE